MNLGNNICIYLSNVIGLINIDLKPMVTQFHRQWGQELKQAELKICCHRKYQAGALPESEGLKLWFQSGSTADGKGQGSEEMKPKALRSHRL